MPVGTLHRNAIGSTNCNTIVLGVIKVIRSFQKFRESYQEYKFQSTLSLIPIFVLICSTSEGELCYFISDRNNYHALVCTSDNVFYKVRIYVTVTYFLTSFGNPIFQVQLAAYKTSIKFQIQENITNYFILVHRNISSSLT